MTGIRFHGRGGQGAVVASKILAKAYFSEGLYVQAFPSFGMERKGAAVAAFVRLDVDPIRERGEIRNPSAVIVLDPTLLQMVDVTRGLAPGGLIVLNYPDRNDPPPVDATFRVACVDAGRIAVQYGLGSRMSPIVNTVILGAFAKVAENLEIEHLVDAVKLGVPVKPAANANAALAASDAVRWVSGECNAA
ncbi:pyruvate/ketoisovalerate ferredoxin oxidoreductase subunit gamma [Desulfosarcina alkanivorans]|uniref:Pyruvate/ketoisovalerate ferredoxin oxidoreductase subunit gamma n=1 Tax=Desulfosarcina alkanivorans TaxID=571177 RepID=A0A5K7YLI7_9BACT|nr:2-oxoacid:acceptor oxidoreductase family protein [Desulfosarcina alkanivorans]BBO69070.1 pyruvate/ketoisovalerate ferredoxin oxidoreductase subunit gamma [Desulfosarcina alkanivorans]